MAQRNEKHPCDFRIGFFKLIYNRNTVTLCLTELAGPSRQRFVPLLGLAEPQRDRVVTWAR